MRYIVEPPIACSADFTTVAGRAYLTLRVPGCTINTSDDGPFSDTQLFNYVMVWQRENYYTIQFIDLNDTSESFIDEFRGIHNNYLQKNYIFYVMR